MTFKFTGEGSSLLSINFTFSEQEVDIYVKLLGNPMIGLNGWRQWRCGAPKSYRNKLEQRAFNAPCIIIVIIVIISISVIIVVFIFIGLGLRVVYSIKSRSLGFELTYWHYLVT